MQVESTFHLDFSKTHHNTPGRTAMKSVFKSLLIVAAMSFASTAAMAACGIEKGSIRILSNDFEALRIVAAGAEECATDAVKVTKNQTTEHKNLQVPALTANPAEYTVAVVANNSIVALLNDGLIRPLDDYVAKYGQDLQANQLIKINGKVMAIAFMANGQHLFIRKDLIEKAGTQMPKSYEDVLAVAKILRDKKISENPLGASDKAGWDLAAEFVNMYLGYGGEFFDAGSAKLAINNDKGMATLKMMKDLTGFMGPDYLTYDSDVLSKEYQAGKMAVINQWGSIAGAALDPKVSNKEVVENTVFTMAPTVGGGSIPAAALWWDGFSIAKNVSDEDAEASFRAMLKGIRPEIAAKNPNAATWLIKGYTPGPAAVGVIGNANNGARPYPMVPYMGLLHTALSVELADFIKGAEPADKAMADVEAAYNAAAKEAGFMQ
jgi:multiple sugar transport system substrate-binding protein